VNTHGNPLQLGTGINNACYQCCVVVIKATFQIKYGEMNRGNTRVSGHFGSERGNELGDLDQLTSINSLLVRHAVKRDNTGERAGQIERATQHIPTIHYHVHQQHHRTVEPPNPVLLLIDPTFEGPAPPLLHDCCGDEYAPLALGACAWWSESRRKRSFSQSYRLVSGPELR
jgi:hypothetical protein